MSTPKVGGVATTNSVVPESVGNKDDDMSSSDELGDVKVSLPSRAELMIENAKLFATVEGTTELIKEMRGDKEFYQSALKESQRDLTEISKRMLQSHERIALRGVITEESPASAEQKPKPDYEVISHHVENN